METKEVGYISKTHGLKGQVVLRLLDFIDINSHLTSLFITLNGSQVPYFIEECNPINQGYLLKLETINSIDLARNLVGKKVSVLPDFIIEDEESYQEFVGYSIIDTTYGNIGVIQHIDEKTQNITALVVHPSGKEIILPFNEDLIEEIDDDEKTIQFNSPEGLISMYLD